MSENSHILASRMVSVNDFIEYLIEKNVASKCTACGHSDAFVSANEEGSLAAQTRSDVVAFNIGTMGILPTGFETVLSLSTVCNNCGYIRAFAAQNVYEWLDKKKKGPAEENNDQRT